jgi:hypothetical protein
MNAREQARFDMLKRVGIFGTAEVIAPMGRNLRGRIRLKC